MENRRADLTIRILSRGVAAEFRFRWGGRIIDDNFSKKAFIASAAACIFAAGLSLGAFAAPFRSLADATVRKIADIKRNGPAYLGLKPSGHLEPIRGDLLKSLKVDFTRATPGVTLGHRTFRRQACGKAI